MGGLVTASSGPISIGGGLPSASHFEIAAKTLNIPAMGCLGAKDDITAFVADRFFNYNILVGTAVSFFASAGAINTVNWTDATGNTTVSFMTEAPWPTDVAPIAGEPFWNDGLGITHNPRDGWVSLTAVTTGEETFFDTNANGQYDSGEPFTDEGEPFVDYKRLFAYSSGDLFFDWPSSVTPDAGNPANPNGIYDLGNLVWDAKIPIFTTMNIVLTGPPYPGSSTSRIELSTGGTPAVPIAKNATATFNVYLSDINMNTLAAGTSVTAKATNGTVSVLGSGTVGDGISLTGPAAIQVQLTSNNTGTVSVPSILSATITSPGSCGASELTVTYPGAITLQ
jgi:hypothetical protein